MMNRETGNADKSPSSIHAESATAGYGREKDPSAGPSPGTIGADRDASRYVQYLVHQYNKFASADPTRRARFHYGALTGHIEARFGRPWHSVSIERANEVFEFIQARIEGTLLARINKGKGLPVYSPYKHFKSKRESQPRGDGGAKESAE